MKELLPVGCVIMASGLSQRFGSNKLLAPFCGEPMLCRAFAATDTPKLSARIVVTRSDEVAQLCRSRNVPVLLHDLPGRNDTVRLGLSALLEQVPELFGCMFLPGDQPLLCRETVEAMAGISGWDQRTRLERQKETEREIFRLGFRVRNDPSPLTGSPVLFEKGLFRNCSPCRRAWAEVFCFGNIPRMFTPFTLRIGMNWPTPTRRSTCAIGSAGPAKALSFILPCHPSAAAHSAESPRTQPERCRTRRRSAVKRAEPVPECRCWHPCRSQHPEPPRRW